MNTVLGILILIILWNLAIIDIRHRIVPNAGPIIIAVLGIVRVFSGELSWTSALSGAALLGGLTLALAVATEGVGGGDVKLFAALGLAFGAVEGAKLSFLSFFLSGIFCAGVLILPVIVGNSRFSRIREIPFVPFIALAASLIFLQNRL